MLQEAAFELERLNYASYQPVNKSVRPRFCKKCQVRSLYVAFDLHVLHSDKMDSTDSIGLQSTPSLVHNLEVGEAQCTSFT